MPLKKKGKNCVSDNISELHHQGKQKRSHKQIVAIAHSACGESKKKSPTKSRKQGRKRKHA